MADDDRSRSDVDQWYANVTCVSCKEKIGTDEWEFSETNCPHCGVSLKVFWDEQVIYDESGEACDEWGWPETELREEKSDG